MNSWTRVRMVVLMAVALPVQAAEVSLKTGFHATVGEAVAVDNGGVAYSYQVRGATTLTMEGATHALSIDCVGLDVTDAAQATTGVGRCVWRDADDHQLMLSVQTAEGRNRYTVTGGTGKWQNTSGELSSGFTYLPSPEGVYLGVEQGQGQLRR